MGATAANAAATMLFARVLVERRQAQQRGGLAATDGAQFGHLGTQAGGRDRAAAGHRLDDLGAARQGSVGGDTSQHALLAGADVGLQAIATVSDAGSRLGGEFGAQLAEGAELYHELAARGQQVTEQLQVIVLGRGRHEAVKLAEAGQHGSVDAVVLGELSEGLGEAPRAQRVDQHGLQAGLEEALMQTAVIAPGGLEDSAADAVLQQPVAQGAAAALVILEVALQTALEDVGVEPGFADIDTGDYGRLGWCHSCVPVLLRYGATPTLPLRSRRN